MEKFETHCKRRICKANLFTCVNRGESYIRMYTVVRQDI